MAVYLIGFALSVLLIAISEKKHTTVFIIGSVAALLIPCLIAAFRAETVGTDVTVYVTKLVDAAGSADSLEQYLSGYWSIGYRNQYISDYEIAFSLMVYVLTKLTGSLPVVLFAIQALVVVPIYTALSKNRKNAPVWLGMLVFYLLFYNATLNMMRQWIAIAFLLLAFPYLQEKKYFQAVLFSFVALLFHLSAILVVPVYAVYWYLNLRHNLMLEEGNIRISSRTLSVVLISIVALAAVMNLDLILNLMSAVGFDRFSNYLKGNQISLMINQIILRLPLILLFLCNWKYFKKSTKAAAFYMTMLLLDMVAAQLISVDVYAFRIGHYFLQYVILAAPALYACRKPGFQRTTTVLLMIAYCLFYWYFTYILELRHETYPYAFNLLW